MTRDYEQDTQFPRDMEVQVRFPANEQQAHGDREAWPWMRGVIETVCGPNEWEVLVEDDSVATVEDGETLYPCVFRDASEIRPAPEPEAQA